MTLLLLVCFNWKAASRTSASTVSGNDCVQTDASECLTRGWSDSLICLKGFHTDKYKLLSSQALTFAFTVSFFMPLTLTF